jgi:hypothetical protein
MESPRRSVVDFWESGLTAALALSASQNWVNREWTTNDETIYLQKIDEGCQT